MKRKRAPERRKSDAGADVKPDRLAAVARRAADVLAEQTAASGAAGADPTESGSVDPGTVDPGSVNRDRRKSRASRTRDPAGRAKSKPIPKKRARRAPAASRPAPEPPADRPAEPEGTPAEPEGTAAEPAGRLSATALMAPEATTAPHVRSAAWRFEADADWELPGGRRHAARRPWWRPSVPWTVYRYVFLDTFRVFLLGILAVSLLYVTFAAYQTVRSGLQLSLLWPLLAKTFAYPLYYSIPISLLFGITLVIGRMCGDSEILALRLSGFSTRQLYTPVFVLGLVLAGSSFYLNGWVVPRIHYEKRNLHKYILQQLENLGSGVNRTLRLPNDKGILWVGAYQGTNLQRVHMDLQTRGRSTLAETLREYLPGKIPSKVSILAKEGRIEIQPNRESVHLHLRGVVIQVPETVRSASVANVKFHQSLAISDAVVIPLSFAPKRPGLKDRTFPELLRYIDHLANKAEEAKSEARYSLPTAEGSGTAQRRTRDYEQRLDAARTDLFRRMAFAISCLTFPLVGVSLSLLLSRQNRLVPFFLGNLVVIAVFYPMLMVGVSLGEKGILPAVSLALPNVALLALGIYLTRKVVRQ